MRVSLLAVLLLNAAVTTVATGCTSHAPRTVDTSAGEVGLAIQIAPGVRVDAVTYTISGNGFTRSETVDVSNSETFSVLIGGIPAGNGYSISLSAISVDGTATCSGAASFDVAASATTAVAVPLRCTTPHRNGNVIVNGVLNVCPIVDALTSIPSEAAVGATLMLAGLARDLDGLPSALSYSWSSTSGQFADPSVLRAVFTCTEPGISTLTLVASDGDCTDSMSMGVRCTAPSDGGGPGNSDGRSDAEVGVGVDVGVDADAGIDPRTDAPNALGPVEVVLSGKSPACLACAAAQCASEMQICATVPGTSAEGPAAGEARTALCVQSLSCAITSDCAAGNASVCYCGTVSGDACLGGDAGTANGVCKSPLERSLETTDPAVIAARFGAEALGGGAAISLVTCLADAPCASCFGGADAGPSGP